MTTFRIPFQILLTVALCACTPAGAAPETAPDEYVKKSTAPGREASEAVPSLDVHPQLEATLFASEPMMLSPSSIDVDHRGRVWVCEVVNYRRRQGERPEGDRILILEDTAGDARADKSTVFYQGTDVDSAHGICVLGNRALVTAGEDVFYLIDDDGDDKADRKELLFTKTGAVQHDHNIHAFHFGPDGRLYFNFGNNSTQLCDKNGNLITDIHGVKCTNQENRPHQEGMVFRCAFDGSDVEMLAWNFRNNWEVCVDSFGTMWQSDNDDDGNLGVRINYVMEFGNFGYKDEITGAGWRDTRIGMSEEIPKRHWHLNDPGVVPNLLQTGAGSPTGICVYEGDLLPEVFHGQPIHCDAGPNVVRAYITQPDGAGYSAEMLNILKSTRDRWFRPSDVCVAPDGSLIVADWYDPGVGGHGMGDAEKGRLFRVAPKGPESARFKVQGSKLDTIEGAIEALKSPNEAARYLAWTALREMGDSAQPALQDLFNNKNAAPHHRARALWLLAHLDPAHAEQVARDSAEAPDLRITALRALRQTAPDRLRDGKILFALNAPESRESPQLFREVAIATRFLETGWADMAWARAALAPDYFAFPMDRWLLEAIGIGAELRWDQRIAAIFEHEDNELPEKLVWRSRGVDAPKYLAALLLGNNQVDGIELTTTGSAVSHHALLRALHFQPESPIKTEAYVTLFVKADTETALFAAGQLGPEAIAKIEGGPARLDAILGPIRGTAEFVRLADRLGLKGFDDDLVAYIGASPNTSEAVTAARMLLGDPEKITGYLRDREHVARAGALAGALGKTGDRSIIGILGAELTNPNSPPALKADLVSAMALNKRSGQLLLKIARKGELDEKLKPVAALALARSPDKELREEAAEFLPIPKAPGADNLPPLPELFRMKGNSIKGKAAFAKATCATCHRVKGEGLDFGPDLTLIGNKLSREAMFESILYPSNAISHGFHGVNLTLKSGPTFIGYLTADTSEEVTLRMAGGVSQTYPVKDIKTRADLEHSLMPPGLAALLTPQELVDLVSYLQSLK